MIEGQPTPIEQAIKEIPTGLTSRALTYLYIKNPALGSLSMLGTSTAILFLGPGHSLKFSVIGGIGTMAATIADNLSTRKAFESIQAAESKGMEAVHHERNQTVVENFDRKGKIGSKKLVAIDALLIGLGSIGLECSTVLVTMKAVAAKSNFRTARMYRRAVEIADQNS